MKEPLCVRVVLSLILAAALPALVLEPYKALAAPAGPAIQGDPQAIRELNAAREKFAALRTYRTRMTIDGREMMVMEVVNPDRSRMRMAAVPGAPAVEITIIGSDQWQRVGTVCRKTTGASQSPAGRDDADPTKVQGTQTVQRGGAESIDGTPTQTYLVTTEFQGQQGRQKYHVTPANGMIRRMEAPSQQGTVIFDYPDYDAPITIAPPC